MERHRVGIIDVGSNTVRLVIFEIDQYFIIHELQNVKVPARLVQYVQDGQMTEEGIQKLLYILDNFTKIYNHYDINRLYAIATAAVRSSANSEDIVKRVKAETDIDLRILSEGDEAYFGNYAVRHSMSYVDGVTVDIGGGSTEITLFRDKQVTHRESLPFGTVSLKAQFFEGKDHNDSKAIKQARKFIKKTLGQVKWLKDANVPVIAIGGSARNIAEVHQRQIDYPLAGTHEYTMSFEVLSDVLKLFTELSLEELADLDGLSQDRKDIIIPATLVFMEVYQIASSDRFAVSARGLREGIVMNYLNQEYNQPFDLYNVQAGNVVRTARKYQIRSIGLNQRFAIADQLLMEMEKLDLISLSNYELDLFYYAATLYFIGGYIETQSKSQHTFYVISNMNLYGFDHKDRVKIALMASYKNKSLFNQYASPFTDWFSEEELKKILAQGCLIKFSEALNDTQINLIENIDLSQKKDGSFKLDVSFRGNVISEQYRAEKERNHLERALGNSVDINFINR